MNLNLIYAILQNIDINNALLSLGIDIPNDEFVSMVMMINELT